MCLRDADFQIALPENWEDVITLVANHQHRNG
uniref:TDP43_N domain-containing protein n=1 Tax=Heterorhabditis bacteriophora TaxID=37862 RepID=A0A1I7X6F4_HETBA